MKNDKQPSQTAMTAAAARAAHLIVDNDPAIFSDTLAAALLGETAAEFIGFHRSHGDHPVLAGARAQVTTRSRYCEDRLADAAGLGASQYVILGAGLDSFAYRSDLAGQVRVFEVDHPATQRWKRRQLARAQIAVPDAVTFVPSDLEACSLTGALARSGFSVTEPAVVSWLGVTMYLTQPAISRTLAEVGGFAPGTELIADYLLPAGLRDDAGNGYADLVMPVAAARGEPWLTFLTPGGMSALLAEHGLGAAEHVRQREQVPPEVWNRTDTLRPMELSVLVHATVGGGQQPSHRQG
jgi:methyltransferase (TIGR00027 family)